MWPYELELLAVYHHPDKSDDHNYCDMVDLIILILSRDLT